MKILRNTNRVLRIIVKQRKELSRLRSRVSSMTFYADIRRDEIMSLEADVERLTEYKAKYYSLVKNLKV